MNLLKSFLLAPVRWSWGGVDGEDCTTFCASWLQLATGLDVASDLRGTYSDRDEANLILERSGGLERFLAARLEPYGHRRTEAPADGDIGVVVGPVEDGVKLIPGIRFGPLWAVMAARGPVIKKLEWPGVAWGIIR